MSGFKPFYVCRESIRRFPQEQNKTYLKPSVRYRDSRGSITAKVFVSFRDSHGNTSVRLLIDLEWFAGNTTKILKTVHADLYDHIINTFKLVL
jgi:hypothetical protein